MASSEPVRWGILGIANILRRFVPALREATNGRLVAVATRRPEAAAALVAAQPDLRVHRAYEDLLSDPEVEAIYIPLPNSLHAEWAVRAAAAGKHVLCEKPLATSLADVERMAAAATAHGTLLMEGFMWRFHPQHARVLALIAAGAIGEVRLVRVGLSFRLDRGATANIRWRPELGGGVLWDVGCYAMSIPRFLLGGEPQTIAATARHDAAFGVDISFAALATFPGERIALLDASMEAVRRSAYEVIGSTGSLRIAQFWAEPETEARLTLTDNDGRETIETVAAANHFVAEIEHFGEAVRGRGSLRYGQEDALAQIRALTALERAFRSGRAERP